MAPLMLYIECILRLIEITKHFLSITEHRSPRSIFLYRKFINDAILIRAVLYDNLFMDQRIPFVLVTL